MVGYCGNYGLALPLSPAFYPTPVTRLVTI